MQNPAAYFASINSTYLAQLWHFYISCSRIPPYVSSLSLIIKYGCLWYVYKFVQHIADYKYAFIRATRKHLKCLAAVLFRNYYSDSLDLDRVICVFIEAGWGRPAGGLLDRWQSRRVRLTDSFCFGFLATDILKERNCRKNVPASGGPASHRLSGPVNLPCCRQSLFLQELPSSHQSFSRGAMYLQAGRTRSTYLYPSCTV